jgi:hypothetical protein
MNSNVVWLLDHPQGVTFVSLLPAAAAARLLAQVPRPGLLQPIAARRLAAVAAVLGQLIAQSLGLVSLCSGGLLQLVHLLPQR